jgi:hypothetical protein
LSTIALAAGTHHIQASYSGDGNFAPSSATVDQTIVKFTPGGQGNSPSTSVFSEPATFTARFVQTPPGVFTPTGTITFSDNGQTLASLPAMDIGGGTVQASFTTSTLAVGNHTFSAVYSGDSNFNSDTLPFPSTTVVKADTLTDLTSSANPDALGQPVTFVATIGPKSPATATPTGSVTFTDATQGQTLGTVTLSGGVATLTTSTLGGGSHHIVASYSGDGNFNPSSGDIISQLINPISSTTTLISSQNPSVFGQSGAITATVSGGGAGFSPTGNVTFVDLTTGQTIGAVALVGQQASIPLSLLATGSHNIQANYNGDSNFTGSSATLTQVVNKADTSTALASSPNPSVAGQPVTFTATVTANAPGAGTPTGSVNFSENGNPIGSATLGSNGQAAITIATLSVGTHSITASYQGDGNFNGSNGGPLTQTVNKNDTTTLVLSSVNPSLVGQSVTFTAAISPVVGTGGALEPSGTVNFFENGNPIGSATLGSNGQAVLSTTALTAGNHTITTTYAGDGNFNGSSGSLNTNPQVVNQPGATPTTTMLISSQNPSTVGQSVTFTATISAASGTPTGSVTFTDTTTSQVLGTVGLGAGGQAPFTTSTLTAGSHNIQASYGGDSTFAGSSATLTHMVNKANPSTGLTTSPNPSTVGQVVTLTAMFAGAGGINPTGTVTFTDQTTSQTLGTATLSGGFAILTTSTLAAGAHSVLATYGGDTNFNGGTAIASQTVNTPNNSTTTLTSSQNPSALGQTVTFTAMVSGSGGTPTGSVTFTDTSTGQALGMITLSGGQATVTTSALAVGSHDIQASYGGDTNFGISSASLTQVVNNKTTTTTTLMSSVNPSTPGQSVTFTATVSEAGGTPTGSVTFIDTTTAQTLGTITLSGGQATVMTITLALGSHNIQASYGGDTNFDASSATLKQDVIKATSTTTLVSSVNPSTPGQPVTFTAAVAEAAAAQRRPAPLPSLTRLPARRSAALRSAAAKRSSRHQPSRSAATPSWPAMAATATSPLVPPLSFRWLPKNQQRPL